MHRAALLFVGFYGILLAERRCPASAAVMLPPDVKSGGSSISVVLRTVRMFLHEIPKGGNPLWIFWILFFPHWTFWLQSSSVSSMWHGWSRGMSFGTNLGQSTILKNDKKMTAPDFPTWAVIFSYKIWHPERELTTVQPAPFLIFIIDSRARIVKRQNTQNTKDKNGPPASAFSGWGGRSDAF